MAETQTFTEDEFNDLALNTRQQQSFGLNSEDKVARRVMDPDAYVLLQAIVSAISSGFGSIDGGAPDSLFSLDGGDPDDF